MKKVVLAACVTSLAFAVSAHPRSEQTQHLGRFTSDVVTPTQSVPESTPTIALALVSLAAVGVFAAYLRGRKSRV